VTSWDVKNMEEINTLYNLLNEDLNWDEENLVSANEGIATIEEQPQQISSLLDTIDPQENIHHSDTATTNTEEVVSIIHQQYNYQQNIQNIQHVENNYAPATPVIYPYAHPEQYYKKMEKFETIKVTLMALILGVAVSILITALFMYQKLKNIERILQNAEIYSEEICKSTDDLKFRLDLKENLGISYFENPVIQEAYAQSPNVYKDGNLTIKASVVNPETGENYPIDLEIQRQSDTVFEITGANPGESLVPGRYELQLDLKKGLAKETKVQDFSWGVLTLNATKSVYTPGETAKIHMAVLDNRGNMVCNADVRLEITNPAGEKTTLSTENKLIKVSDGCSIKDLVVEPDYATTYTLGEPGTYQATLTANTNNGEQSIQEQIIVVENVPFDIERITATRIYPIEEYPVILKITPNVDYKGTIKDFAPDSYNIYQLNEKLFDMFVEYYEGETVDSYYGYVSADKLDGSNEISWEVDWKQGETYYLGYKYDAPDRSPDYHLLGELEVWGETGERPIFKEYRKWQIAVDLLPAFRMEIHKISDANSGWATYIFDNEYVSPVVIVTAEPNSSWSTDDPPYSVNIRNVDGTGADLRITLPDRSYGTGVMPDNNIVYMMVVEEGYWDGTTDTNLSFKIEAQKFDSDGVCSNSYGSLTDCDVSRNLDAGWGSTYHHYFSNASIDNEDAWIETAMWGNTSGNGNPPTLNQTSGIIVGLSSAEVTPQDDHLDEEIHFVVIEDGTHSFDSQSFRADRTPDDVVNYGNAANADTHLFGTTPLWGIADQQAMDGADGSWTNWQKSPFTSTTVTPYDQEDRYQGSDETNHTTEEVDYFIADTNDWSYQQDLGLTQGHYHWRKDNGSESTATSYTGGEEDTAATNLTKNSTIRLRTQITNLSTGSDTSSYRLEYGAKSTTCAAIGTWTDVGAGGGDWDMSDSTYLFDGSDSTNIAINIGGVTDENDTFLSPNGAVKDTSSTTGSITLATTEFAEIEYSIKPTSASTAGGTYCFRVTDSGTPVDLYAYYPEATIRTETFAVGEVGQATTDYQGTTIAFTNRYENPVVIAETISFDDGTGTANRPAAAMITHIDGTGFSVRIQETDAEADDHGDETFGWMVMEEGAWELQDGTLVDAGKLSLTASQWWNGGTLGDCNYTQTFSSTPTVFGSLQTNNNNSGGVDFLSAMIENSTSVDFDCGMGIEDGVTETPSTGENFGWIAFEAGIGTINNIDYEFGDAGTTIEGYTDTHHTQNFSQNFSSSPIILAQRYTGYGGDEGWIRYDNLSSSSVELFIDENDDSDRSHTTTDSAYYAAFESAGNLLAKVSLEQAAYRWFQNSDSLDVGNTMAAQDTAATLDTNTDTVRLRLLFDVGVSDMKRYGKNLKLQYAEKSGTCDVGFLGETYLDVGATTPIAYYNNPTPDDGDSLTDNANDPSHGGDTVINQTYEEANYFRNDVSAVTTSEDALWDFSLYDYDAPADTTYCIRAVEVDDDPLSTYSVIPEITAVGINLNGTAYTDDDEATPLTGVDVCTAVDSSFDAGDCDTTDGSGIFNIINVDAVAGNEQLSIFVDGATNGNIITVGNTSDITNLVLYQNHVLTRYETGSDLSIADMDAYDNDQNSADMLFDAEDLVTDTLTWESGMELYIPNGYTFVPGGNVNGHDIEIDGVWTAAASETINIDGTFKLDAPGIFNESTSTLTFDAASGTEDLITDGSGDLYNLVINDSGGSLVVEVEDPLSVLNNLTITNGTLDVKTENNQINVGGNWTNDDTFLERSGTIVFDGATDATLDSGCANEDTCTNENFYNLIINKAKDAQVTLANTNLRVTNIINVITGWLIQGAQNVRAEGSTAVNINDYGRWSNTSTGDLTLGGNLINDGNLTINANGMSCNDSDSITIASTNTTSRSWSGEGGFRVADVNVSYQTGSATIYAASSTDSGNMGSNWHFVDCNETLLNNLDIEGIDLN